MARSAAVTGLAQPVSGSNVTVEGRSPSPTGLNTYTGPRAARSGPVWSSRSVRVEVTMTAPGWSMTWQASSWVLPLRGPPKMSTTSSMGHHTVCAPTRHSRTATSSTGKLASCRARARAPATAREGRIVGARRRIAVGPARREMSTPEATPDLRRMTDPHRVTVAAVAP